MAEVAASPSVFADIRVVRRLNGLGAVTDAAWERPGDPRSDLLVLTRRGAVVLKGSDLSEVRRIEWDFKKEIAGVGTTWQVVRFKDGPRAVSMPGIGASMLACADPATGQLLWTREVPGGTVLSAALRGPDGRIRFAVAGQYGDRITWLNEQGEEMYTSQEDVQWANEYGQFLVTDLDANGIDELFHASYANRKQMRLVLRDYSGKVLWRQDFPRRARWLQIVRLGRDIQNDRAVVTGSVTIPRGLFELGTVEFAARPLTFDDQWTFQTETIDRNLSEAMMHRGTAIPCTVHGQIVPVHVRGDGQEMSPNFLLRVRDAAGVEVLRTTIRNETLGRKDLFAKGQMVGRSPLSETQAAVLVCFADTIYEVSFKESDPVP